MAARTVGHSPAAVRGGDGVAGSFVSWGAILSGTVIGLAVMLLLNSLWFALAEASNTALIADNLHWFAMASALGAVFLGGLIAGWMTGVRGVGQGLINGLTVWGLVVIGTLVVAVPGALQVVEFTALPLGEWGADPLWATFWAVTGGMAAAAAGGIVGGALPRPGWYRAIVRDDRRSDERHYDWEHYRDPSVRHDLDTTATTAVAPGLGDRDEDGQGWPDVERRQGERRHQARPHDADTQPVVDVTDEAERRRYQDSGDRRTHQTY